MDEFKMKYTGRGLTNAEFKFGDVMKTEMPPADCLMVIHVLHHLNSFAEQDQLMRDCVGKLKPGGKLLICEVQSRPWWKLFLSYCADYMLYPGDSIYYRKPAEIIDVLKSCNLDVHFEESHKGCPFPHVTYVATKRGEMPNSGATVSAQQ